MDHAYALGHGADAHLAPTDLQRDGAALGVPERADNARMIRVAGPIVAEYFRAADGVK